MQGKMRSNTRNLLHAPPTQASLLALNHILVWRESFFSARVFPLRRFLQPFSGYQTPNTLFALRTLGDWGRESSLVLALVSDDKYYLCIHFSMGCLNHKKLNLVDWKGKKADLVLPTAVMSTEI